MKTRLHVAAAFLLVLTACASLGIEPANSFGDRLAYAYGTYAAVNTAAASSLDAKTITREDAESIQKIASQARALLDGAKLAANGGDLANANSRLTAASAILTQLQQYLRTRGAK